MDGRINGAFAQVQRAPFCQSYIIPFLSLSVTLFFFCVFAVLGLTAPAKKSRDLGYGPFD